MSGFIEGSDRSQASLFPERLEDWICEDNPVRIVDVFVEALHRVGEPIPSGGFDVAEVRAVVLGRC